MYQYTADFAHQNTDIYTRELIEAAQAQWTLKANELLLYNIIMMPMWCALQFTINFSAHYAFIIICSALVILNAVYISTYTDTDTFELVCYRIRTWVLQGDNTQISFKQIVSSRSATPRHATPTAFIFALICDYFVIFAVRANKNR